MVIKLPLERLSRHSHAGAWERENEKLRVPLFEQWIQRHGK